MNDEQYMNILEIYTRSVFQDFESFLRTQIDLIKDDIKLVLDEYNSSFISYELEPGIYTFKDISEALLKIFQPEYDGYLNAIDIKFDDIIMKTNLEVRAGIISIRFDEKSFFSTILGFTSGWDYKHYNKYTSQKGVNLGSTNKIHLNCDCIDGSVVNGIKHPILFSFVSDKKPGYKVFSEPGTIHYKKINKSVLNTITFYLEEDKNKVVDFNGETLTFTLQMIKIWTIMFTYNYMSNHNYLCYMFLCYKWAFKKLKVIVTIDFLYRVIVTMISIEEIVILNIFTHLTTYVNMI